MLTNTRNPKNTKGYTAVGVYHHAKKKNISLKVSLILYSQISKKEDYNIVNIFYWKSINIVGIEKCFKKGISILNPFFKPF